MYKFNTCFLTNNEFYILLSLALLSLIFWDTSLVYPVKFFVVLLHEISHALMTFFSGGTVKSILINSNLSGATITNGGNLILISSSGYLGSLIGGISLYVSSYKIKFGKWVTTILSAIILISSINLIRSGTMIFFSLLVSLIFYISPRYFNTTINSLFLKFIGLTSIFYVVTDIKQDLLTTTLRETDSQVIEYVTGVPALLVGFIWLLISIATVWLLVNNSYKMQKKKGKI